MANFNKSNNYNQNMANITNQELIEKASSVISSKNLKDDAFSINS